MTKRGRFQQRANNVAVLIVVFHLISTLIAGSGALAAEALPSGQPPKKTLSETLRQTVIFIYEDDTPPNSKDFRPGRVLGTAFVVGIPVGAQKEMVVPVLVTAKHVIADRSIILARYSSKKSDEPVIVRYDLNHLRKVGDFWEHPDKGVDIVVFRTPVYNETVFETVPIDLIASRDTFTQENIGFNDPVVIPALLADFPGTAQNFPIFRSGSIALITQEPIEYSWQLGKTSIKTTQQVIFINSTLNEGFSGAPVFMWPGPRLSPQGIKMGGSAWLIGIVQAFHPQYRQIVDEDGEMVSVTKPIKAPPQLNKPQPPRRVPVFSKENSGTGIIFPSWKLLEVIQSKEFQTRVRQVSDDKNKMK